MMSINKSMSISMYVHMRIAAGVKDAATIIWLTFISEKYFFSCSGENLFLKLDSFSIMHRSVGVQVS